MIKSFQTASDPKSELRDLLKQKSVFYGDFTLSSGGKSRYYVDCKLTTFDPRGAWLVGRVMHELVRREEALRAVALDAVGGLTMGADPICLAIGMMSCNDAKPLQIFSVRKTAKAYGQTKLIEGNFKKGNTVVVVDDVVTRGESTLAAIHAVVQEGGKVAFVAVLVDRDEGGRQKIEAEGYPVIAAFQRNELIETDRPASQPA
jgi:orotate phosphoribosyltransferase